MPIRKRLFHLGENNVDQVLFGDNSDDEETLALDEEDLGFLEKDLESMEKNGKMDDVVEVTIEPPQSGAIEVEAGETQQQDQENFRSSISINQFQFKWKKTSLKKQKAASEEANNFGNEFSYGKINIEDELSGDITPYEVFELVSKFTSFITDTVIPQTVLYSQQNGHVFTTDIDEIKAFFGMHLVMGYHVLPSLRDYWSTDPDLGVPYIANVMCLKRFEEIRRYLHFNDNAQMTDRSDPNHDRAFKLRPVLKHFNECFLAAMQPTKCEAIDEHMIRFKGHNIMRQYVKGKPIQWGFKMWCRCDSKSGFLFEFDLYTGKKLGCVEHGLGEGVVLSLTEKLEGLECQIYFDNYFNSPSLQAILYGKKIFSAGTVRINRKNVPKKELIPTDKEMGRGDAVSFESNHVFFTKWLDNKAVHMVSNFLAVEPVHEVKRRIQGSSEKKNISCPVVIQKYNEHMGGVDIMDQKKVTYQFNHRSKIKYYLRVVFDLIDIAVNNSGIIFNKLCEGYPEAEKLDLKSYRRVVARCLIGSFCNRKRKAPTSSVHRTPNAAKYMKPTSATKHTMQKGLKRNRCKVCYSNKKDTKTNNF